MVDFPGHSGPISSIAFSENGECILFFFFRGYRVKSSLSITLIQKDPFLYKKIIGIVTSVFSCNMSTSSGEKYQNFHQIYAGCLRYEARLEK